MARFLKVTAEPRRFLINVDALAFAEYDPDAEGGATLKVRELGGHEETYKGGLASLLWDKACLILRPEKGKLMPVAVPKKKKPKTKKDKGDG